VTAQFITALASLTELGSAAAAVICVIAFLRYASADRQRTMASIWDNQKRQDERDDRLFAIILEVSKQKTDTIRDITGEMAKLREAYAIHSHEIAASIGNVLEILAARDVHDRRAAP
jgi:hypothetical protein